MEMDIIEKTIQAEPKPSDKPTRYIDKLSVVVVQKTVISLEYLLIGTIIIII